MIAFLGVGLALTTRAATGSSARTWCFEIGRLGSSLLAYLAQGLSAKNSGFSRPSRSPFILIIKWICQVSRLTFAP